MPARTSTGVRRRHGEAEAADDTADRAETPPEADAATLAARPRAVFAARHARFAMPDAYVIRAADAAEDGWNDPSRGRVSWRTLFSADAFPSAALSGGVGHLEPGGFLAPHRHAPAEIYFVLDGHPVVTIDGVEHAVGPHTGVFIPGDAEHGIRNDGDAPVRFFYAFAVDRFSEVAYRFDET